MPKMGDTNEQGLRYNSRNGKWRTEERFQEDMLAQKTSYKEPHRQSILRRSPLTLKLARIAKKLFGKGCLKKTAHGRYVARDFTPEQRSAIEREAAIFGLIKTEAQVELLSLDKRRRWEKGTPTGRGGGERSMGENPEKVQREREARGINELALLYPSPHQIEDCRKYKRQVGSDARVWLGKTLVTRVDIKSNNEISVPQVNVALSSEIEGVPYYIFNPDTGQAMIIDKRTRLFVRSYLAYSPEKQEAA